MSAPATAELAPAWLWYADRDIGGSALDASTVGGKLAAELSVQFSVVHVLREQASAVDAVLADARRRRAGSYEGTVGSILRAPWADNTFDCIVAEDALVQTRVTRAGVVDRVQRIRALLKPGGWFVGSSPNPAYRRFRRLRAPGISPLRFSRVLTDAHFRDVRRVFVTPSLERPLALVPDAPAPVKAYEAFDSISGATRWRRQMAANLGLRNTLYPAYFIFGRA